MINRLIITCKHTRKGNQHNKIDIKQAKSIFTPIKQLYIIPKDCNLPNISLQRNPKNLKVTSIVFSLTLTLSSVLDPSSMQKRTYFF